MIQDSNKIAIIAGEREVTFAEVLQRIHLFAQASPKGKDCKSIVFSENREGWIYAFFSAWENHTIPVPVDASSTVQDVAYILNDCKPSCIWTSRKKVDTIREAMAEAGINPTILLIDDYELAPVSEEKAKLDSNPEDTAVIIYTSGTTGNPKGVMLSFANLEANTRGVCDEVHIFNDERRTLVLLPLHHILPLMGTCIIPLTRGAGVAICPSMTGPDIMDTLSRGKIAIMVGVPRLYQTLYNGIKKKIDASPVTRALFAICSTVKSRKLSRFIFQSVRKKMGGHLDYMVSGGAALDKEIGNGLRTLGLDVLEGYGMSETAPIISFTRPGDIIPGCVGLPLPSVECKIVNGELCAKGPNVMQGYYNRPEETAAVIDADGFIHTGDLAEFDEKGRVYITGRTKEIIVLSNGKNVQPNEIEYKLEKYDDKIKEAAVVQDGDLLRAIIVPQAAWANNRSVEELEVALKREVIEPYNLTVANYKKLMSIFVYQGELPRTRLDKLQRFKLKEIIDGTAKPKVEKKVAEPTFEEYQIIKRYIEAEKKIKVMPTDHIESDLAFDSLDKVGLQSFIENTFGMEMRVESMATYKNVTEMAEYVADYKTRMDVEEIDWNKVINQPSDHLNLPITGWELPLYAKLFKLFLKVYNRLSIKGKENIPQHGPFILAPNHQSFIDGPIAMAGVPWDTIKICYFYAKEDHVKKQILKNMANRNNIILMEKNNLKDSILKLAEVLKQGKSIVIFPEGTRTHTGEMSAFKKMFAILSSELQVPIVPVCIKGAFQAFPRTRKFMTTHKIEVEYLPNIYPSEGQSYDELSDKVRQAIGTALKKEA